MTKTELKENITKIKKLLKQRDYDAIDTGIELARALDEPAVFEALLGGWSINDEGKLVLEEGYQGETLTKRWSAESWRYFAYALVNLIGYAPKNTKVDKSLEYANIKTLYFKDYYWNELPSGLANLPNLTTLNLGYLYPDDYVDVLVNCTNLSSLDLRLCSSLQNVDGLANLPNLTSLDLSYSTLLQNLDGIAKNVSNLTSLVLSSCDSLQNVDGLANLTNLASLDLSDCRSLKNVDGLANLPNLTSLVLSGYDALQVPSEKSKMTTRDEVVVYQDKIRIVMALKNGDMDVFSDYKATTILNLSGCTSIKNVDGLAKCTKLTSLDLKECESLQNVEPLIQLQELKVLSMEGCKKVDPLPRPMNMKTRSEVENYFRRILKKVGRKIPDSLKSKTPKDLKSNLAKIKKLILKRDYDAIDTGIELARALDEPAVFEMLLEGCSINEEGKIIRNKIFTGSGPIWVPGEWNGDKDHYESDEIYCGIAQSYLDYALVNLIGFQPKNAKIDRSLKLTNINKLNLSRFGQSKVKFVSWSRPEYYNKWDKIPSCIGKFRNITSIDISNFRSIKDLDIFSNLTNLTNLNLKWCSYLENVDGLAKLLKLTKLNLSICKSLQNMDGLANLTNLTTIKITPNTRLISSTMTTREEVAAYQEEIKKSMK